MNIKLAATGFSFICLIYFSCKHPEGDAHVTHSYFLSDIRPVFFERLNFNSKSNIAGIPSFLKQFSDTYKGLEENYNKGVYISWSDRNNMRLASQYYSFGITAIIRAYLDGFISFDDITGGKTTGLFSGLSSQEPGFREKELEAMMSRSQQVARFSVYVNGFNDKTYGTFMVSRQISERLKNPQHFNNPQTQDSMLAYLNSQIVDYEFFSSWNVLMSQLSFTNYRDSLNTFKNPRMEIALANLNSRALPPFKDRYAGLLGQIFRFDLNLKKVDWLLHKNEQLSKAELTNIAGYLTVLDSIKNNVEQDKKELLNSWEYKQTIYERMDKLGEVKSYVKAKSSGNDNVLKPQLTPFFTSKNYLQSYQCYNCHRPVK